MRLLVISGLSGSGKSIALQSLEDLDFYCVDNLPLGLLRPFVDEMTQGDNRVGDLAVGIDARTLAGDLERFPGIIEAIRGLGIDCEILFLEASDQVLFQRFSETRRKHPLTDARTSLRDAIRLEREMLAPIEGCATTRIDSSHTHIHQLRSQIRSWACGEGYLPLSIQFMSFGFKQGVPVDADFVFDVRCLPNPHWDPRLRLQTGRDPDVADFLGQQSLVSRMIADVAGLLEHWIPAFEAENRSYLNVAIGCTGGRHRSVYIVETLADRFAADGKQVIRRHRDLE